MNDRVQYFLNMIEDCTEDESAEIKRLFDNLSLSGLELLQLSARWPMEHDEWVGETLNGLRPEYSQKRLI